MTFGQRPKGVDMRIGLDIASMSLKKQIHAAILVSRRLWQGVSPDLSEHIDGLFTPLKRGSGAAEEGAVE